jgi:hypothetical protein
MTTERDFDRLARAWLELGPDEAPDRVVAAVLQAAETTPQVRRRIGWSLWRPFHMTRLPIVATAVAALVVVIGGGMLLTRGNDPGVGGPTAAPTPSTSPSTSPATESLVAADLRHEWISGNRTFPGLEADAGTDLRFTEGGFLFAQSNGIDNVLLRGLASSPEVGRLRLATNASSTLCGPDDVGLYDWSLTPGGTTLTITAVSDSCPQRLEAVAGTWNRVRCTNPDSPCLGKFEAGTYRSQFFTPSRPPQNSWVPNYGGLTFTVPGGWAASADWPQSYDLVPAEMYPDSGDPPAESKGIYLHARPAAHAQSVDDTTCPVAEAQGVGHTVDDLIGWISRHPGLDAGEPTPITINGRVGQMIDVKLATDWTATCAGFTDGSPGALLFTEIGTPDDFSWAIGPDQRERIILLDIGGGQVVLIDISASQPAAFDALVADAMPIIQSFEFE